MDIKKKRLYFPIILATILATGIFLGVLLGSLSGGTNLFNVPKQDKVGEVIRYIQENYVDTISHTSLVEKSVTGLLQKLDPHSVYITAAEFNEANDPLIGSFEGIGVQFRLEKDTITVINPITGGPSEMVGIRAGDRIVKINGEDVAGKKISTTEVMRKLKGPKGTEVGVSIYRRGEPDLIDFTIIRGIIPTYSLDIAYLVSPGIGYVRLNNFSATTFDELHQAIENLLQAGMQKLILDLEGNTGGLLPAAIDVSNEFLAKGDLIVYTEGEHTRQKSYYANGKGSFQQGELVVLIDQWSASAAEIVAGAIQDNDRGTIIGRRSFGKGLVQEQLNFRDGSAVRLTVARYHTPTGRCIQKSYDNGTEEYYADYYQRMMNGELENADSIKVIDSLKYVTPRGKIVYGGGGIVPDLFVPIERTKELKYYNALINKGLLYRFAFDYTDAHRKELEQYTSFEHFDTDFHITNKIMKDLTDFAEKNGVIRENVTPELSDVRITVMLKAYIGRNILDNEGFFPYLNRINPTFLKGKEVLEHSPS